MFFLKTEGTSTIPSFVEIRDDNYTIVAHIALSKLERELKKMNLPVSTEQLLRKINEAPFGKIIKVEESE